MPHRLHIAMRAAQTEVTRVRRYSTVLLMSMCAAMVGAMQEGRSAGLEVVQRAHQSDAGYEVSGGAMIPVSMLEQYPPEAQELYDRLPFSLRQTGPDDREFVLINPRRWIGDRCGNLRIETRAFGRSGPQDRATRVTIWTNTMHAAGMLARSEPDILLQVEPISLEEQWQHWSQGRIPLARMRTREGGYIEVVRYCLYVLKGSADTVVGINQESGQFWARSDNWKVHIEADPQSGEVQAVSMGMGKDRGVRIEYVGRLPRAVFPARNPEREINFTYEQPFEEEAWWIPTVRPNVNGYLAYTSAMVADPSPEVFEWKAPKRVDGSVPPAPESRLDLASRDQTKPLFEQSTDDSGRVVPNRKASPGKTLLLAAGIALFGAGVVLALRRGIR